MEFYHRLVEIMKYDAGKRGLKTPEPDLAAVADTLLSAERVLILTGFPVLGLDKMPHGETDGPAGAAEIACTLALLGSKVWLASDETAYPVLRAAAEVYGRDTEINVYGDAGEEIVVNDRPRGCIDLVKIHATQTDSFAKEFFLCHRITHLVSIERPGKGVCGHYCNMCGNYLDAYVADTDSIFSAFSGTSIAIGDGGNELGMGKYRDEILNSVPHGEYIAAELSANYVLTAGVSNWWGPGLAALLSYKTGKNLMTGPETEICALQAVLDAGGLDGWSGRAEMTVDSLPLHLHLERRALIHDLLSEAIKT